MIWVFFRLLHPWIWWVVVRSFRLGFQHLCFSGLGFLRIETSFDSMEFIFIFFEKLLKHYWGLLVNKIYIFM
jgi:hypothetical protein